MRVDRQQGPGGLETLILAGDGVEARVVPSRGALVTHWRVGDEQLLFLDEATLVDRTKNVRGGIPLLFPNAGPLPAEGVAWKGRTIRQPQHGLARLAAWSVLVDGATDDEARVSMTLASSPETKRGFPFDFDLSLGVTLTKAGVLSLDWVVTNTGDESFPLHLGLHPYFAVPVAQKARARVPTTATRVRDGLTGEVKPVTPVRFDGPEVVAALLGHGPRAALERGDGSRIELTCTPELSTLVLWTLPGQPFVCVEPWTAPGGALASGEGVLTVEPGASAAFVMEATFVRG